MSRRCGAKTRKGGECRLVAGLGTDHAGAGACRFHTGSTPDGRRAGARELARQHAVVMGLPVDTDPIDALRECIARTKGEILYADREIGALKSAMETTDFGQRLHPWVRVRQDAIDRLSKYAKLALDAGVDAKYVEVMERQADQVVAVVRAVLAAAALTPDQEQRARDELYRRLLAAERPVLEAAAVEEPS